MSVPIAAMRSRWWVVSVTLQGVVAASAPIWCTGLLLSAPIGSEHEFSDGDLVALGLIGLVPGLALAALGVLQLRSALRWGQARLLPHRMLLVGVDGLVLSCDGRRLRIPWHALGKLDLYWSHERTTEEWINSHRSSSFFRNWLGFEIDREIVESDDDAPRIDVARFESDPRLVVSLIEFYRDHPEERAELRTVVWQDRAARVEQSLSA